MLKLLQTLLVFILLAAPAAYAQSKTDREQALLFGPVKSVRTDNWGSGSPGQAKPDSGETVTYDRAGNEIERLMVSDYGEPMGKQSQDFDSSGRLVESRWTDPKGVLIERQQFSYREGKLVEVRTFEGNGVLRMKKVRAFSPAGRLTEETYFDPVTPRAKSVFQYDAAGDQTEISYYLFNGTKAVAPIGPCLGAHRVTFTYDPKHRPITKRAFESDDREKRNWTYEYDDKGNLTSYSSDSGQRNGTKTTYSYDFDAHGNWTKRTATTRSDDAFALSTFETIAKASGESFTDEQRQKVRDEFAKISGRSRTTTREITYFK